MNKTYISLLLVLIFFSKSYGQQTTEIQLANEYYGQGEYEKAKTLYEDLAKDYNNIPLIHNNYFFLLLETASYNNAEKYIKKLIKRFPENLYYKLDLGLLIFTEEGENKADTYFRNVIDEIKFDNYRVSITADYFVTKKLTQYAVITFMEGRKSLNNPFLYSLELANIYRIMNEKDKMVEEYLNYVIQTLPI